MTVYEDFVTIQEAFEILKTREEPVYVTYIRRLAQNGEIPGAEKRGGVWWIPKEWAKTFKRERKVWKKK